MRKLILLACTLALGIGFAEGAGGGPFTLSYEFWEGGVEGSWGDGIITVGWFKGVRVDAEGSIRLSMTFADGYAYVCPFVSGRKLTVPNTWLGCRVTEITDFTAWDVDELEVPISARDVNIYHLTSAFNRKWRKIRDECVQSLGDAYGQDFKLEEIELPNVEIIDECALYGCYRLHRVVTSDKLKKIGEYAFRGSQLTEFKMHEGLEIVEGAAFGGTEIKSLYFPSSVTNLDGDVTYDMPKLKTLQVHPNNLYYEAEDNILYTKHKKDLISAVACSSSTIYVPSSVTNICYGAFSGMDKLTSVVLQPDVRRIDNAAFSQCTGLTQITLPALDYIGENVFWGCANLQRIIFLKTPPKRHGWDDSTLMGLWCPAKGVYQQAWAEEWEKVIVNGKYYGLPMEGFKAKTYELPDKAACDPKVSDWTNDKLTEKEIPPETPIDLGPETTTKSLNTARLLGVDPEIVQHDDFVEVSSDIGLRIISFAREADEFVVRLEVQVKKGSLPDDYQLNGAALITASESLDGEWVHLQPASTTLTRDSSTQATITLRFTVDSYRFFKVRIVDAEDIISLIE